MTEDNIAIPEHFTRMRRELFEQLLATLRMHENIIRLLIEYDGHKEPPEPPERQSWYEIIYGDLIDNGLRPDGEIRPYDGKEWVCIVQQLKALTAIAEEAIAKAEEADRHVEI